MKILKVLAPVFVTAYAFTAIAKDLPTPKTPVIDCKTFDDEQGSARRPGKLNIRLVDRVKDSSDYEAVIQVKHRLPDQGYQARSISFTDYTSTRLQNIDNSKLVLSASNPHGQVAEFTIDLQTKTGSIEVRSEFEDVTFAVLTLKSCTTKGDW